MREQLLMLALILLELETANQLASDAAGVQYTKARDTFDAGQVAAALGAYLG